MNDRMVPSTTRVSWLLFISLVSSSLADQLQPTASPSSEFMARPRNVTVLQGYPAVLRCKMRDIVHNCQWFYLKETMNMFQSSSEAVLVKEFRPIKKHDCSIKFNKTRVVQSGQWVCKGLQIQARKYIVSEPAFLRVIPTEDNSVIGGQGDPEGNQGGDGEGNQGEDGENELSKHLSFHLSEEGHIINTNLGDTAMIGCQVNKELETCSWIRPDGTTLHTEDWGNELYMLEGNFTQGNCSLMISKVSTKDEGNWRCVVTTANHSEKLSPLIHLHVFEFGSHFAGDKSFSRKEGNGGVSLIGILVATSVALLVVIVLLVFYMYRRIWRNDPSHKYLEANRAAHCDYSTYGTTWLQGPRSSKLIDDGTEMQVPSESGSMKYPPRYLDMTGRGKPEGCEMFPALSARSSMSSRTTLSTFPVGHNAVHDQQPSTRSSTNVSLHSSNSLGGEGLHGKQPAERSDSVESDGHLYEEIDELRLKQNQPEPPFYVNVDEDDEGYMIPRKHSLKTSSQPELPTPPPSTKRNAPTAPPYSKVGIGGLIPDSDPSPIISNPTYSATDENPETPEQESYNTPHDPPVPVRVDSADNPLAEYDVPKKSEEITGPVFV